MRTPPILAAVALALVGLACAETDRGHYGAGDPGTATLHDPLKEPLFLQGCAPFVFERSLDGAWTRYAAPFECIWQGIAVVVDPGEELDTPFDAPVDSGRYRVAYDVGWRCEPDRPLDEAACQMRDVAASEPFEVERELCDASDPDCRAQPAAPNTLCEDGEHVAGPAAECTRDPSTGRCGYELLRCP